MFLYQIIFYRKDEFFLLSALSAESKKKILCVLCGSAVKIKHYT